MRQPRQKDNERQVRSTSAAASSGRPFRASRLAAVAAALIFATIHSAAAAASGPCGEGAEIQVLPSPAAPWSGAPLRVMIIAERPLNGAMSLIAPDGSVAANSSDRHGGGPYFWFAEVGAPSAGTWHATLALDQAR